MVFIGIGITTSEPISVGGVTTPRPSTTTELTLAIPPAIISEGGQSLESKNFQALIHGEPLIELFSLFLASPMFGFKFQS